MTRASLTTQARVVAGVAGVAIGLGWWWVPSASIPPLSLDTLDLLLFILAVGVLELLTIRTPDGREVGTSVAVVAAAAVLGAAPPVVALIATFGMVVATLREGHLPRAERLLERALLGWSLAGVAGFGMLAGPPTWSGEALTGEPAMIDLGAAVAVGVALMLGGPLLGALGRIRVTWRFAARRVWEAILLDAPRNLAIVSTGVLGALVHPVLGAWTLPTMLIPLAAVRFGLDREGQIARAYDQTVRAMSRLPEQLGELDAGHGERVASLAREIAFELGFDADAVREVSHAAYLHELGRIQIERPDDSGRERPLAARREVADAGAAVVRRAAGLETVADIVAGHGDLTRVQDQTATAARVVAACCDIDRYAPDPAQAGQRQDVLVRLVREVGNLEVLAALERVLDRREAESSAP